MRISDWSSDVCSSDLVVDQPADDLAFERIVNTPKRGWGDNSVAARAQVARGQRIPLSAAATFVADTDDLPQRARGTLARLAGDFERWRDKRSQLSPSELAELIMEESGYIAMLKADRSIEAAGRLEDLQQIPRLMEEYETLEAFLEHISLVTAADQEAMRERS